MDKLRLVLIVLICGCYSLTAARPQMQEPIQIDCTTGSGFPVELGATVNVFCPPCERHAFWGDGTYSDNSSVCSAAAHQGVIQLAAGGAVTIQTTEGLPQYVSATHNGLTSNESAGTRFGFRVVGGVAAGTTSPGETGSQSTAPEDAESKAALCTLLQLHQGSMVEEAARLSASVEAYNVQVSQLDAEVSLALDQYVACDGNCDTQLFSLITVIHMRNYTQSQATALTPLLENNRQSQASNQSLQAALVCPAS